MATGLVVRGGADGIFGQQTRTAVLVYQRVNGLPQTGIVDEATAKMLGLLTAAPRRRWQALAPVAVRRHPGSPAMTSAAPGSSPCRRHCSDAGISFTGGADGVFGSATAGAVMKFQRARGLRVTGKVDQATAAALGLQAAADSGASSGRQCRAAGEAARQGPLLVRRHVAGGTRQRTGPPRRRHRGARGHTPRRRCRWPRHPGVPRPTRLAVGQRSEDHGPPTGRTSSTPTSPASRPASEPACR